MTYATQVQEGSVPTETINHVQQEDVVDFIFSMRDVPVPLFASLTTARLDFQVLHYASGTQVVVNLAQMQVELLA